jgi:hypothetical protein
MEDSFNNQINPDLGGEPAAPHVRVDPRASLARKLTLIFLLFSLVLSGVTSATLLSSKGDDFTSDFATDYYHDPTLDDSDWDTSWIPYDFSQWSDDSNIAWRWADNNDCDTYACVSAEFISRDGCSGGFYVAVNWLDEYDNVISYTNESLPSLQALQTAKLRFDDFEENSDSGQVVEIRCY